jgi:hypothetical protein
MDSSIIQAGCVVAVFGVMAIAIEGIAKRPQRRHCID